MTRAYCNPRPRPHTCGIGQTRDQSRECVCSFVPRTLININIIIRMRVERMKWKINNSIADDKRREHRRRRLQR